jgi:hypothetical protein
MSENTDRVRYGNWLADEKAKLMGLPLNAVMITGAGLLFMLMFVIGKAFVLALVVLIILVIYIVCFVIPWGLPDAGRTLAARARDRLDDSRRRRAGELLYTTGAFSNLPEDSLAQLPGALVDVEELDGRDGMNMPYTLLHHRKAGVIAATMSCIPDGTAMQPQEQVDTQVSKFGGWVSDLSKDSSVAGAMIVADSSLSSSEPLAERTWESQSETAPTIARQILAESIAQMPAKVSTVDVYATVAWRRSDLDRDIASAQAEIAARLPQHRARLYDAGGGPTVNADSARLAKVVQTAYSPSRADEYSADAFTAGRSRMRLSEAGPDYFDESMHRRVVLHDGVASMTVMMLVPPRMHITENQMAVLFEPSEKFLRKRVAVYYRPLTGGEAIAKARRLLKNVRFTGTGKRGPADSFDEQKIQLAKKTEQELVKGATMTQFMIQVTVTFEDSEKAYREARTKLKAIMDNCDITFRYVESGRSAAFHSTLPLGILPWLYPAGTELFGGAA